MTADISLMYGIPSLLERLMNEDDSFSLPAPEEAGGRHFPPVQMLEGDEAFLLRVSIPGASIETVSLEYSPGKLVIRGYLPPPRGVQHRMERPSGPFRRDVDIPCRITGEGIHAVMRNGLLTVTLPKASAREGKRSIPVTGHKGIAQ